MRTNLPKFVRQRLLKHFPANAFLHGRARRRRRFHSQAVANSAIVCGQTESLEDRTLLAFPMPAGAQKIAEDVGGFDGGLERQDRFGRSTSTVGDLDQDGVIDIAVGARSDDDGGTDAGAVYVITSANPSQFLWPADMLTPPVKLGE